MHQSSHTTTTRKSRPSTRALLPKLLDEYKLLDNPLGRNAGDDAWIEQLSNTLFRGSREEAAEAVAEALSNGFAPESIGEAMSLAANKLVLHDPGRTERSASVV